MDEFNEYDDKLLSLGIALNHVNMKEIIKDLERDPRLMLNAGNHRQRRTAKRQIANGIVAEA